MVSIHDESPDDIKGIHSLLLAAFANHPISNHTEQLLVDELRRTGTLVNSIVAKDGSLVVGHIAFSKVLIDGKECGWYCLAPLAVLPDYQRQGIGIRLMEAGLNSLQAIGAKGCVLAGDIRYYCRFGFTADNRLTAEGIPPEAFLIKPLCSDIPTGKVEFAKAFEVCM